MIPDTFEISKKAPSRLELTWIHNQVKTLQPRKILEFGCGATTYAIGTATAFTDYVAVETYSPSILQVKNHLPNVWIVNNWEAISPRLQYDFVFIDSSALSVGTRL